MISPSLDDSLTKGSRTVEKNTRSPCGTSTKSCHHCRDSCCVQANTYFQSLPITLFAHSSTVEHRFRIPLHLLRSFYHLYELSRGAIPRRCGRCHQSYLRRNVRQPSTYGCDSTPFSSMVYPLPVACTVTERHSLVVAPTSRIKGTRTRCSDHDCNRPHRSSNTWEKLEELAVQGILDPPAPSCLLASRQT